VAGYHVGGRGADLRSGDCDLAPLAMVMCLSGLGAGGRAVDEDLTESPQRLQCESRRERAEDRQGNDCQPTTTWSPSHDARTCSRGRSTNKRIKAGRRWQEMKGDARVSRGWKGGWGVLCLRSAALTCCPQVDFSSAEP
jgi:hypothetical protein